MARWPPASIYIRRLLIAIACLGMAHPAAALDSHAEVPVGARLHEVELQGLNGPARQLSAFRGRPLVINVWASWCGPCRQEMESLERLAWRRGGTAFAIIGISTDDYPERAMALLARVNSTISHFIDTQRRMEDQLGATRLPLTVFVDADGRVLRRVYGARDWDDKESLRLIDETFGAAPKPAAPPSTGAAR